MVSTLPVDGATHVDTAATVVITFNAPLDTSARFAWPPNFFLGLEMSPEPGDPDSVSLSADLSVVRVHNLHLSADTRYVLAILGARSSTGALLQTPTVMTFTTGSSLPTATVSGKVTLPGGDASGTLVALFSNLGMGPEALAVALPPTGNFRINYVPPGVYYPVAIKDVDHSGDTDPNPAVDLMAAYDPDGDGLLDNIVVEEGAMVTGVDLTLHSFAPLTARQRFDQVVALAQTGGQDPRLVMVGCQHFSPSGEAPLWFYVFWAPGADAALGVMATSFFLAPFPWEEELPDTTALPVDWVDSAVAADSAEASGGAEFRETHPDAEVEAFLSHIELPGSASLLRPLPKNGASAATGHRRGLLQHVDFLVQRGGPPHSLPASCALVQVGELHPAWLVQYNSDLTGDFLAIIMDAQTARVIFRWPPPVRVTTAAFNIPAAAQAAQGWASDARLVWLGNHQSSLTPSGQSEMWYYAFYSPSLATGHLFFFTGGMLLADMDATLPFTDPLPQGWIDSDIAAAVAEAQGGTAYRTAHPDAWVQAMLGPGLYPWEPGRPVWWLHYTSSSPEELSLWIDPLSAQLLTNVYNPSEGETMPRAFALLQNFPNPFNPHTAIAYHLPQAAEVEILVLNVKGEKVATLADGFRAAGFHKVLWNGTDAAGKPVAGGVYLCRLSTPGFVAARKMLLLR
ncbi:MAG: hypothetical protein ONB14_09720 [candidate division KSB1 bacterium]|nr:hypothetical protein [candidate division KSB1 bacterium]